MTTDPTATDPVVEQAARVLHRAYHDAWSAPDKELDLYADSPIWQAQARAILATAEQSRREGDAGLRAGCEALVAEWKRHAEVIRADADDEGEFIAADVLESRAGRLAALLAQHPAAGGDGEAGQ